MNRSAAGSTSREEPSPEGGSLASTFRLDLTTMRHRVLDYSVAEGEREGEESRAHRGSASALEFTPRNLTATTGLGDEYHDAPGDLSTLTAESPALAGPSPALAPAFPSDACAPGPVAPFAGGLRQAASPMLPSQAARRAPPSALRSAGEEDEGPWAGEPSSLGVTEEVDRALLEAGLGVSEPTALEQSTALLPAVSPSHRSAALSLTLPLEDEDDEAGMNEDEEASLREEDGCDQYASDGAQDAEAQNEEARDDGVESAPRPNGVVSEMARDDEEAQSEAALSEEGQSEAAQEDEEEDEQGAEEDHEFEEDEDEDEVIELAPPISPAPLLAALAPMSPHDPNASFVSTGSNHVTTPTRHDLGASWPAGDEGSETASAAPSLRPRALDDLSHASASPDLNDTPSMGGPGMCSFVGTAAIEPSDAFSDEEKQTEAKPPGSQNATPTRPALALHFDDEDYGDVARRPSEPFSDASTRFHTPVNGLACSSHGSNGGRASDPLEAGAPSEGPSRGMSADGSGTVGGAGDAAFSAGHSGSRRTSDLSTTVSTNGEASDRRRRGPFGMVRGVLKLGTVLAVGALSGLIAGNRPGGQGGGGGGAGPSTSKSAVATESTRTGGATPAGQGVERGGKSVSSKRAGSLQRSVSKGGTPAPGRQAPTKGLDPPGTPDSFGPLPFWG